MLCGFYQTRCFQIFIRKQREPGEAMDVLDIWIGGVNLTALMLAVSVAIVLPVQLLLCFKVKSRRFRCMPVIIFFLAAAANILLYMALSGWRRLIFLVGAIYMGWMVLMCGAGWVIWAVVKRKEGML